MAFFSKNEMTQQANSQDHATCQHLERSDSSHPNVPLGKLLYQ